jgi:hypothetical protein
LSLPEGGFNFLDQLSALQYGKDPRLLVEWSDIIERKANDVGLDSRVKFKGSVNDKHEFVLDMDAPTPDATLRVLQAIESCLDLMPGDAKEFYAALMDAVATDAEKRDETEGSR